MARAKSVGVRGTPHQDLVNFGKKICRKPHPQTHFTPILETSTCCLRQILVPDALTEHCVFQMNLLEPMKCNYQQRVSQKPGLPECHPKLALATRPGEHKLGEFMLQ